MTAWLAPPPASKLLVVPDPGALMSWWDVCEQVVKDFFVFMIKAHCINPSSDPLLHGVYPNYFFKSFLLSIRSAFQIISSIFILVTDEDEVVHLILSNRSLISNYQKFTKLKGLYLASIHQRNTDQVGLKLK
ncbi:MAG TPA: hypothetical protein DDX98_13580 [Bacteroidales bacterium]|jgi:hypothetical protein|nr:hypothetical protein [Bacteroidales bacterium]